MLKTLQAEYNLAMKEVRYVDAYRIQYKISTIDQPSQPDWVIRANCVIPLGSWLTTGKNYGPTKLEITAKPNLIPLNRQDGTPVNYVGGKMVATFLTDKFEALTILIEDLEPVHKLAGLPMFIERNGKTIYNPDVLVLIHGRNITIRQV